MCLGETIADRATMPLNFLPEVPEYAEHTEAVLRHGRGAVSEELASHRASFKDSWKAEGGDGTFRSRGSNTEHGGSFLNRHQSLNSFWDAEGGTRVAMSLLDYAKVRIHLHVFGNRI